MPGPAISSVIRKQSEKRKSTTKTTTKTTTKKKETTTKRKTGTSPIYSAVKKNKNSTVGKSLETKAAKASKSGESAAKGVKISKTSKKAHRKTKDIAATIRKGSPEVQKRVSKVSPTAGKVIGYPIESGARIVEMSGMLPGGVEVMARRPEVIKSALAVGAYESTVGVGKAFKENPAQTVSDFATIGLITHGAGKVPKVAKTVKGSKVVKDVKPTTKRLLAEEVAQVGLKEKAKGPEVKINFDKTYEQALKESKTKLNRDLTATEKKNLKQSVRRSIEKEKASASKRKTKSVKREDTLAKQVSKEFAKQRKPAPVEKPAAQSFKSAREFEKQFDSVVKVLEPLETTLGKIETKRIRLNKKLAKGQISKAEYNRQIKTLKSKETSARAFREEAIEIKPVRELAKGKSKKAAPKPKAKAKTSTKAKTSVKSKVKYSPISLLDLFPAQAAKPVVKTALKTDIKVKAPAKAKTATKTTTAVKVREAAAKPKSKGRSTAAATSRTMPQPKLPTPKGKSKGKTGRKPRTTKQLSGVQINNQIATLRSILG